MYHVSDKLNEIERDSFTSWESAVQMQTLRLINFGELAVEFAGRCQKQNDRVKRNTSYLVVHRLGQPQHTHANNPRREIKLIWSR